LVDRQRSGELPVAAAGDVTRLKLRNVYSLYRIQTGENRHHVGASPLGRLILEEEFMEATNPLVM
jgi:hypothetical protein